MDWSDERIYFWLYKGVLFFCPNLMNFLKSVIAMKMCLQSLYVI